jgi:hypothetical protein
VKALKESLAMSAGTGDGATGQRESTLANTEGPPAERGSTQGDERAAKAARIRDGLRRFAHLTASSERFLQEKWAELDAERKQYRPDPKS